MVQVQVRGQLDRHDDVLSCSITCDGSTGSLGVFALPTGLVLHDQSASCMSRIEVAERGDARRATVKKRPVHRNGTAWRSCGREPGGENRRTVRDVCVRERRDDPVVARPHINHTLLSLLSEGLSRAATNTVNVRICTGSNFVCNAMLKVTRPAAALLSPLALYYSTPLDRPSRLSGWRAGAPLMHTCTPTLYDYTANRLAPHAHPLRIHEHPPIQMSPLPGPATSNH